MKKIILFSLFLISFSALASNAQVACRYIGQGYLTSCLRGFEMMKNKQPYAHVLINKCRGEEFKYNGDVEACQQGALHAVHLLQQFRYSYELEASINCINNGVGDSYYPYCIDGYMKVKEGGFTAALKRCRQLMYNGEVRACETGLNLAL